MLLTCTLVVARSMIVVVVIVLSRLDSIVDLFKDMHFVLVYASPRSFNFCPLLADWCYSGCDCGPR